MLSLQVEPPAPAEGPLQNMQVVAALPAEPVPPSDEEPAVQEDALVRSLTTAPEKKAKRAAKTPAKNRRVAKALPLDERRGGYLTAPHHRLVTVGHIFFPVWRDEPEKEATSAPRRLEERRRDPRRSARR